VVRVPGYGSRGPRFDSRRCQFFWEVVGLERGPLSLVSTTEELLGRNSSGSGLESREYGHGYPLRWPRVTIYQQKLALTSPTIDGHSVGIVRSRTKVTEFVYRIICSLNRFASHLLSVSMFHRWILFRYSCLCTCSGTRTWKVHWSCDSCCTLLSSHIYIILIQFRTFIPNVK
jgi:hypothetical protein